MADKHTIRARRCEKCGERKRMTAAEIKEHAEFCGGKP